VSTNAEFVPPHDSHAALYIRPLVFGSSAQLNLTLPEEFTFCVYVQPVTALHGQTAVDALILEEFDRAAPKGTGSAKVGGNYSPILRWALKAKAEGFGITLHLDSKTRSEIEEFSVATFIGVKRSGNEITLVTPDSPSVIKGVTSDSCLALAKEFGWNFEVRQVSTHL
jgi:branched-chain amino acid aminotransferase